MQKTAVVTGGAGFLGSHLCDKLISEGHKVICIDNLLTGYLNNISHLFGNENFHFVKHDVTNFIHVPGNVDYILHFASPASPIDYLKLPPMSSKKSLMEALTKIFPVFMRKPPIISLSSDILFSIRWRESRLATSSDPS